MKRLARLALVLAALVASVMTPPVASGANPGADTSWSYARLCDEVLGLEPQLDRAGSVQSVLIERDAAVFVLEQGQLAFARPIGGRVCAALFIGRGQFRMAPAAPLEREQLERFYKTPVLSREFQSLLLVFADSTAEELASTVTFETPRSAGDLKDAFSEAAKYLGDAKTQMLDPDLTRTLLGRRHNRHFIAILECSNGGNLRFEVNPYATEEVSLRRVPMGLSRWPTETVCQFRLAGLSSDSLAGDTRPEFAVRSYAVDVRLADNLDATVAAHLECEAIEDSIRFLSFWLYPDVVVDSARWGDGRAARVFHHEKNAQLWLDTGRPLARGERFTLDLQYHGKLIMRGAGALALATSYLWYPTHDFGNQAQFDLTFRYPGDLTLVSIGDLVSSERVGKERVSHWKTREPCRWASWHLGGFKQHTEKSEGLPEVTALITEAGHTQLGLALLKEEGLASGRDMGKQVALDVSNSVRLFTHIYGPLPLSHVYAAESRAVHGEAFAGMVLMNMMTFQRNDESGEDEILRAHEVAHQWWPYQVGFRTYHDQWLSEAFAEFSGLWYLQLARGKNTLYFDKLEEYRHRILDHLGGFPGKGVGATPIGLGARTRNSVTPEDDYAVVVYLKGAWVLHMLRNYFLDLKTMSEDRFIAMLRDFYGSNRGERVSTADFRRVVEKHAAEDMGWFFREWVNGGAIPKYRFAWKAEPAADGTTLVTCRIAQRDVPDDFRMEVPVRVDFGGGAYARIRVSVTGPVTEARIAVPQAPRSVTFNDLASVLCSVENVDW